MGEKSERREGMMKKQRAGKRRRGTTASRFDGTRAAGGHHGAHQEKTVAREPARLLNGARNQ